MANKTYEGQTGKALYGELTSGVPEDKHPEWYLRVRLQSGDEAPIRQFAMLVSPHAPSHVARVADILATQGAGFARVARVSSVVGFKVGLRQSHLLAHRSRARDDARRA